MKSSILALEKPNSNYKTDFLREHEIKELLSILDKKGLVVIIGEEGRGKTTFIKEAFEFCQKYKIHSLWFDCHEIYRRLTSQRTVKSVQSSYNYVLEWANNQPSNQPFNQQPILFIDAGDWLFLTHSFVVGPLPAYKSALWDSWMKLKQQKPTKWVEYILKTGFGWTITDYLDHYYLKNYPHHLSRPQVIRKLINSYQADIQTYLAQEAILQVVEECLQCKKVRVVLTDHNLPNEHTTSSPFLLAKYQSITTLGASYNLPARYEVNRARLFILKKYQIADKTLQDEIIVQTEGLHLLLKLALDPNTIELLKKTKSPKKRKNILQQSIYKIRP